jgi:hypothetical protein
MGSGDILSTDSDTVRLLSLALNIQAASMPIEPVQMQQCPVNIEGTFVRFCLKSSWLMASTIYGVLYY